MMPLLSSLYLWLGLAPYTWFALLVAASLADATSTVYALTQPGAREANPVMRWAMDRLGTVPALLAVKAVPLVALFVGLQAHILFVPPLVLVYASAAGWNLWAARRIRA